MMALRLLLILPLLLGTGCGMTERFKSLSDGVTGLFTDDDGDTVQPHPLTEFVPVLNIREKWSKRLGDGTDELFLKLTPVVVGEVVYAAERDGHVYALELNSGDRLWKTDIDRQISGGPGAGQNLIVLGTSNGEVVALGPENGKILWTSQVSSEILAQPRTDGGVVVVRTGDGKVYGLSAPDGRQLWVYDRSEPVLTLRGTSAPLLAEGLAVTGFDNGRLVALDVQSGKQVWESRIAIPRGRSDLERMVDIDAEPVLMGDTIYVSTFQGHVAAVALRSGEVLWTRELSSHAGIGVDEQHVYISDANSHVLALNRYSGESVWQQEQLANRSITAPVSNGRYVIVCDLEGYVHWLHADYGDFIARARIDKSAILVPALIREELVLAYSTEGTLAALSAQKNEL